MAAWLAATVAARADLHLPAPDPSQEIVAQAGAATQWTEGLYHVRLLSRGVSIRQGETSIEAEQAVLFTDIDPDPAKPRRVIVYAEGSSGRPVLQKLRAAGAKPDAPPVARQQSPDWYGTLITDATVEWRSPPPAPRGEALPEIASRALKRLRTVDTQVQPVQFDAPAMATPLAAPPAGLLPSQPGFRQVDIYKRSAVGTNMVIQPDQPGGETIYSISEGVQIVVQGIDSGGLPEFLGEVDSFDLETDRAVVWAGGNAGGMSFQQQKGDSLEIYMEGNIVFRQGDRVIYADRMYYDVRSRSGVVLNAELLTPLPEVDGKKYRGLVRLKAGMIRQLDATRFVATDALFTSSRLEEPSYHFGAETITFEDVPTPIINPLTGLPDANPATGEVRYEHERLATARNSRVYLGGVPVFYWPTIATDLEEPTYYVTDLSIGNDSVYGFQFLLDLDVYQLLGSKAPKGVDWDLSLDYLRNRGFGYGTEYSYNTNTFLGHNGPARGRADLWAIHDGGLDNLGFLRRSLVPEASYRGRAFWNHRQNISDGLLDGWIAQAEVGWISDRTFLEQYYESEWDENKDQITGGRLRRLAGNQSLSIEANARLNEFFTQTQWLPRLDHWIMGQDLLGDTLTWYAHTNVGYADYKIATAPADPLTSLGLTVYDAFPWEAEVKGERFATRHEIDFPIDADPFKIVPFALGEFAHWGEDLTGDDLQRTYIHTGVRASIPFWAANPEIRDPLFNLHGLAHKVVFDAEVTYTDASENFDRLPLYDEIEDDSLEEQRRRYFDPLFAPGLAGLYVGGAIDPRVDPRVYAIRGGIHSWVASPTTELVDDQMAMRVGMRHRLQTKRGKPGQERIIDWLTFDSNATWFPDDERDNFGEPFGLLDYTMQWHVGDRTTFLSDGFADTFADGLRTVSGGVLLNRPTIGNLYVGYRTVRGPFSADLVTATLNYRMSPKWIGSASTVVDFSEAGNIGQSFLISRLGEAIITSIGINVDPSKGNVGFNFAMEPRFLPSLAITRRTGIDIPPAGYNGLE
ncbi:LPS-assembly protein LptD [Posidoniimonas corsicana]|uniref:LPS-assembly protein LptD n=1 Tax=Posidoniimonas corsicana TaxID=1938618 RepID=A0A5C5VJI0_9BACT|nr:LPS-assembly protein LptD [Posidoniimonas corsicana]TWT37872.1 LPS-assembly protein LptD [Posidoniimonas corsicana]